MINPKYSLETEQEVLETLMHFSSPLHKNVQAAMLKLNVDCFYNGSHRLIFSMIKDCFDNNHEFHFVDILSRVPVSNNSLHSAINWLMENYNKCFSGESRFENYVERLIILSQVRRQIILAENMIMDIRDCSTPEGCTEIISKTVNEISSLTYHQERDGIDYIDIAEDFYEGRMCSERKLPTTSAQLNFALQGGIIPKSLIIIAAGASVGKTGFSIFLMDAIARMQPNTQSLFFSIEMEYKNIWERHVGICAKKSFDKLTDSERLDAISRVLELPTKIYDTNVSRSVADIDFILTTSRLRAMKQPISVIVVDYLGLVETTQHFERNDLKQSYITSKLAQLAIELNCTVIALSQINRGAANRGVEDRCPWPHDAADSSGGHRSCSLWFGVDRPQLYQEDPAYRNQFVVKCRKNRFGDTFDLIFAFNEGTFAEVSAGTFRQPRKESKSPQEYIFSAHGKDFCTD